MNLKAFLVVFSIIISGCDYTTDGTIKLPAGTPGTNGTNGHSIVPNNRTATVAECPTGGSASDLYMDTDDSKTFSDGDVFLSGAFACNGSNGETGAQGDPGQDGSNGHSIVPDNRTATVAECPTGGSASDLYMDTDDSQTFSEGDVFLGGVLACNGATGASGATGATGSIGATGANGTNATANVTAYNFTDSSACQIFISGSLSGNKQDSNKNEVRLYGNSTCSGGSLDTIKASDNEIWVVSDSTMLIIQGSNSSGLYVRKVVFQ